jgi:hypothetical protein
MQIESKNVMSVVSVHVTVVFANRPLRRLFPLERLI